MIKVFLVEDEYVIRQGIKNNIDWTANGFLFCGEAGDGELALPLILKEQPDIVITDIKMPFMNGLELSKLIKKELPETEIIILSGYEEFEYAQEAIKIGVAEYLLKPITGEEILKNVGKVADKVLAKQREKEMYEKYRLEMEEGNIKERRELFDQMVSGTQSASSLIDMASKLDTDITAIWYNILLVKVTSTRHEQNEFSGSVLSTDNHMAELAKENGALLFDRDPEGKAVVFKADTEEELREKQNRFVTSLLKVFEGFHHIHYFGGIGMPVNRLGELPASFESASRAFAHRYLLDEDRIITCEELDGLRISQEDDFNISSVNPSQIDHGRVAEFLKLGDVEEVRFFVEEFFHNIGAGATNSNLFRQYITMDVYFCVAEFVENLHESREIIEPMLSDGSTTADIESTIAYLCRILETAFTVRDRAVSNRYDKIVEMVTNYVEENYKDDELTISAIASYVNFSPNHLSMVYRQETGQTLIKFLTDFRLNKAKELLKCTSMRSSEISLEVGYKDPHYFSYLFKKSFGMTPTQYREGAGGIEETAE